MQTVDYSYNIRGWLRSINDADNLGNDLFGFEIGYNTSRSGATKLYNGNISETYWKTQNDNVLRRYGFSYDALSRIVSGSYNGGGHTDRYSVSGITYDKNGNILSLQRQGHTNVDATLFGTMDNLTYAYDGGNKLLSVTDAVTTPALMKGEFKDGNKTGNDYGYDANGNLTQDLNKGIPANGITYNHLNLPTSVAIGGGNISYIYDASGTKLQKTVTEGGSVTSITDYAGNYIYENGDLQFFSHAEGYVDAEGVDYDYVYQYKDHLGNIRLSYQDADSNGSITTDEIVEESNYYPFGLRHKGYNNVVNGTHHPYMHAGKELQEELGANFYDFEARGYDPAIGRFMQIDEMSIVQTSWTPYHHNANNPIKFTDPTGLLPTYDWDTGAYLDDDGNEISWQDALGAYGIDTGGSSDNSSDSGGGCDDCSKCPETCKDAKKTTEETKEWDNSALTGALATSGILLADDATGIGVVDDVAIPFILVGGVAVYLYDNAELMAKQAKEINRILEKKLGPSGFTYALVANQAATTVDVRGNIVQLNPGDVWKYGETSKGFTRYSQSQLDGMVPGGVSMVPLFFGNVVEIKVQEKIMIYGHVLMNGSLPPGNKIFR